MVRWRESARKIGIEEIANGEQVPLCSSEGGNNTDMEIRIGILELELPENLDPIRFCIVCTVGPAEFLPKHFDGRILFEISLSY